MSMTKAIVSTTRKHISTGILLIIAGVGLVGRLLVTFYLADPNKQFEYQLIASNLIHGLGMSWNEWGHLPLQPTALFPPLYIYWCALFQWLFGLDYLPMFVIQGIVAALGVFPAFRIGRDMFSERVGYFFATAYAVYPELVFIHSRATPEFLYVIICLWLLSFYVRMLQKDVLSTHFVGMAWLMGAVTGVGLLIREGVIVVAGAVGIALLLKKRPFRAVFRRLVVPVMIVVMVVLAPWTIRNWIIQGHFIPLRTAYGLNLWMGNHANATGSDRTVDGDYQMNLLWTKNRDYYKRVIPDNEYDRNSFYRTEAISYIKSHPLHYLRLTATRLGDFLWFVPNHQLAKNAIYRASYILLLLSTIPGIMIAARQRRLDIVLILIYVGFLLLYVPVIVLPRYRIICVVLMLLMSAVSLDGLVGEFAKIHDKFIAPARRAPA